MMINRKYFSGEAIRDQFIVKQINKFVRLPFVCDTLAHVKNKLQRQREEATIVARVCCGERMTLKQMRRDD